MTEMMAILDQLPDEGRISRHNFYVVYLARDPRGIINSVESLKEQWPERLLDPKHICSRCNIIIYYAWFVKTYLLINVPGKTDCELLDCLMIPLFNQTTRTRIY